MGLRINTNVPALSAQRTLGRTKERQDRTLDKLASGERITRAADDSAGLAISEKLKSTIASQQQAVRNSQDGVSLIQTAEGGLSEISNILTRLRELSIQAASDTLTDNERGLADLEYQSLVNETTRISKVTRFNDVGLLDGSSEDLDLQVGINNVAENDRITFNPQQLVSTADDLGISGSGVSSKDSARENLEKIDMAIGKINGSRAVLGSFQNRLNSTINNTNISIENLSLANSRIRDADIASETANLAKENILASSGVSVLAQANSQPANALRLLA